MKKRILLVLMGLYAVFSAQAENYLLNGGQESRIEYKMVQKITPVSGTKDLILSYVIPRSFSSPSYNQVIQNFKMTFSFRRAQKNAGST